MLATKKCQVIGWKMVECQGFQSMFPLYHEDHFTFRFADERIIPRFHLEGVECGRAVSVFRLDPVTGGPLDLIASATAGEGGWVDLTEPILVRAGDGFIAVLEPAGGGT